MDKKTIFFTKLIDQLIYIQILKDSKITTIKEMVYKLPKLLYGLKQVSRLWYKGLSKFLLKKLDLHRIKTNHSIFITITGIKSPIVSIFTNDIKIMEVKSLKIIDQVKRNFTAAFKIVDIGLINFYFSLKVDRSLAKKTLKLLQPAYIDKILIKYHLN